MADTEFSGFGDAETVRGGGDSKLTFEFLVLEQVRRCAKLGSDDWYGGYFAPKPFVFGGGIYNEFETYLKATHTAYLHAVISLYDLLSGHVGQDVHSAYEKLEEEKKAILRAFDEYKTEVYKQQEELHKNHFNSLVDDKRHKEAEKARFLFRAIMKWLKSVNFLKGTGYEEGMLDER